MTFAPSSPMLHIVKSGSVDGPFKIATDVPIPRKIHKKQKYPFAEMGFGDSFFVGLTDDKESRLVANRIRTAAKSAGFNVTTRLSPGQGVRVWRIE